MTAWKKAPRSLILALAITAAFLFAGCGNLAPNCNRVYQQCTQGCRAQPGTHQSFGQRLECWNSCQLQYDMCRSEHYGD